MRSHRPRPPLLPLQAVLSAESAWPLLAPRHGIVPEGRAGEGHIASVAACTPRARRAVAGVISPSFSLARPADPVKRGEPRRPILPPPAARSAKHAASIQAAVRATFTPTDHADGGPATRDHERAPASRENVRGIRIGCPLAPRTPDTGRSDKQAATVQTRGGFRYPAEHVRHQRFRRHPEIVRFPAHLGERPAHPGEGHSVPRGSPQTWLDHGLNQIRRGRSIGWSLPRHAWRQGLAARGGAQDARARRTGRAAVTGSLP